jgi:hypothetical protein
MGFLICHPERSNSTEGRIAESKDLRTFTIKRNYMRYFDFVFLSFQERSWVEKNSAQEDKIMPEELP